MEVYIENKDLEDLYRTGRSRKLKLPKQVVDKFFATVQKIEAAETIHDLLADKGLHFEKLKGFDDRYSMRLNQKYRLEMRIEWKNEAHTVGIFFLLTISNHYQ
ncbi:MAG: type II toxin-antitoxin system RelE/ParE family toxin [Lewinellaceae bacterium]|nr:type II toxin-antitoxin system RelE/ParE family toxin [Lewinellaceae bacterium]